MSSHDSLINVARTLGYTQDQIKEVTSALNTGAAILASADRERMTQLVSPVQAGSQSARHAAQLRKLDQTIYHASGCKWRLPTDGSLVDELELNRAIANAALDTRSAIRAGLYELSLIRR